MAFENLKEKLVSTPVLALPDNTKPSQLFVHEEEAIAWGCPNTNVRALEETCGVLVEKVGPSVSRMALLVYAPLLPQ